MKSLLVSTAVVLLISGAPAAWAQPDERGGGKHQDRLPKQAQARDDQRQADRGQGERGRRGQAPAQVQAAPAATPAQVQAPVRAQVQAAPAQAPVQARPERQQRQQRPDAQAPTQMQVPVQAQVRPERQPAADRRQQRDNPQGTFRNQAQPQVQGQVRPQASTQVQADRSSQVIPPRHVEQRNQWQSNNQDWNRGTVWQRDRNWWRGNDAFRNYSGVRLNFFFAPGFGYYSVPLQYRRHSWHEGDYLPRYCENDRRMGSARHCYLRRITWLCVSWPHLGLAGLPCPSTTPKPQ